MKKQKPKIIVILGPTATGKSDMAVSLAKKFCGEVVSADSRQVYKGLDIGTGKITKIEMRGITHHLLDVVSPKTKYSVERYKKDANIAIKKILKKGHIPIICGGTGFYIDAIVKNQIFPNVPPNTVLRNKLQALSLEELQKILKKLDSRRAKEIDPNNKVRLIRAIEIAKAIGKVPPVKVGPLQNYNVLCIGLNIPKETLREKINKRLRGRLQKGMINEAKKLHKQGVSWKRMEELGLEYRYLALYLQEKISKEKMIEELQNKIWQYAKRQMTWFRREKQVKWFSPKDIEKIEKVIKNFLKTDSD